MNNLLYDSVSDTEKMEIGFILEAVYRITGYDFREYNFASVRRRIWHRARAEKLQTLSALLERIVHHSDTRERLISDLCINVTEMFRDPAFFSFFRKNVIPYLREFPSIKIWHAGCSTGEEVYSMAILLHEEGLYERSCIYATDIDQGALETAKSGIVPVRKMKEYTKNYVQSGGRASFSEYYRTYEEGVVFHPFLRENMVFAQHNLATDSSLNEFHLIFCRNVLIYFNHQLQDKVHQLIYDSLSMSGYLVLGGKESAKFIRLADRYYKLDTRYKVYRKIK